MVPQCFAIYLHGKTLKAIMLNVYAYIYVCTVCMYVYKLLMLFPTDAPYLAPTSRPCLWNITSPTPESAVILTEESMLRLSNEICQNFNCGQAFKQNSTKAPPNSTCLTDCIYHNYYLWNCSTVVKNNCLIFSNVTCGKLWNLK